jgi:hypothetical protein
MDGVAELRQWRFGGHALVVCRRHGQQLAAGEPFVLVEKTRTLLMGQDVTGHDRRAARPAMYQPTRRH